MQKKPLIKAEGPEDQEKENAVQEKNLKKQFESYVEVLKHRNGGAVPSLDDVLKEMSQNPSVQPKQVVDDHGGDDGFADDFDDTVDDQAQDSGGMEKSEVENGLSPSAEPELATENNPGLGHPKVLDMKIYYGMSRDDKGVNQPDENKILYYEDPDGLIYDCGSGQYTDEKPNIVNHLPARPMRNDDRDVTQAIMHGVLDDDDFLQLENTGLISDHARQMKKNMDKLSQLLKEKEELELSRQFDPAIE